MIPRGLQVAIGFLTRLPVPQQGIVEARAQAASVTWYPVVGLLIGALLCALAELLRGSPPLLAAAILVASWVALTGALHLDGLADSADAWIGGLGSRERTLSIMQDPRAGPAGVVALVLVLLLKFAALASLPSRAPALLLAPLLARAGLTALFVWMPYVRRGGLGTALTAASRPTCRIAIASVAAASLLCGRPGLHALIAGLIVWLLWRRACMQRIGGFTGDTAGATAELIETIVVTTLALFP